MPTLIAIDQESLAGYRLDSTNETFLRSDVGIAVWAEHDGLCHRLKGVTEAKIRQTVKGPVVEICREELGTMVALFRILCVDVLGIAPAVPGRINEYRDLLSEARGQRVMH